MSTETAPAAAESLRRAPSEDPHFIASVIGAAGDHDAPLLRRQFAGLSTPDLADVMEHVPLETARTVARLIGRELPAEFLADLSWERREEVLPELPADYVGKALDQLDTDDAAATSSTPTTPRPSPPTSTKSSSARFWPPPTRTPALRSKRRFRSRRRPPGA